MTMPSFHVISKCPHQKLFFDIKDKNYKKDESRARLDEKIQGMTLLAFLMVTIFLVSKRHLADNFYKVCIHFSTKKNWLQICTS